MFNLEERIPVRHLLRRINPIVTRVLADLREKLKPFYSETGEITPKSVVYDKVGEYEYVCDLPGHHEAGMKGTLIVSAP